MRCTQTCCSERIETPPPQTLRHYCADFDRALMLATVAHDGAMRKGTLIPYIMHPLHVARLLERHGFSEEVVLAGLLHDVLEDAQFDDLWLHGALYKTFPDHFPASGKDSDYKTATEAFIAVSFGPRVLDLVNAVTERKVEGGVKRPWRVRKEEQIAHLRGVDTDTAGLKAADALHNAQAILRDVRTLGLEALRRFNCSIEELIWSYETMTATLPDRLQGHAIVRELEEAVFELTNEINRRHASKAARCCSF